MDVELHNARQTVEALEKKHRKRTTRMKALQLELAQLENSMPRLGEKIEQAKAALKAAKAARRGLGRSGV